ncbi:hypothetical protein ABZ863_19495 [Saccharomonospora sp. NPDC046836]|uniref:hypothetical protein n=1 Tax=Saccharomonospora sp. NPDC046836 TaxID=3156921 RepID=UPI0033F5CA9B
MAAADRRLLGAAMLIAATATLAACAGGGGGPTTTAPAPPPAQTAPLTTTPGAPTTGASACTGLADAGQGLVNTVTDFFTGQATGNQVRAAATSLSNSIDAARSSIGTQTSAQLDNAKASLQQLQSALSAQPPDTAAIRTAANNTRTALRDAATICQSGTPTPSPRSTS